MKVRHGTEASGGGRSAPATPITLGFKSEEEEEEEKEFVYSYFLIGYIRVAGHFWSESYLADGLS